MTLFYYLELFFNPIIHVFSAILWNTGFAFVFFFFRSFVCFSFLFFWSLQGGISNLPRMKPSLKSLLTVDPIHIKWRVQDVPLEDLKSLNRIIKEIRTILRTGSIHGVFSSYLFTYLFSFTVWYLKTHFSKRDVV